MVKHEMWVAGLKRKAPVEITYGEAVEGSRGTRYRLYGTYTDTETKKIHKANSFVSKAAFDEVVSQLDLGSHVADIEVATFERFAEESPLEEGPSDQGGPEEPVSSAPADVGGDMVVPVADLEAEDLAKTSCCCGATEEDPCACMVQGVMSCSSVPPMCACYEALAVMQSQSPQPGTWASIARDMAESGAMTPDEADRWKDEMKEMGAEMTLQEWGDSELEESKHDFQDQPNQSFKQWLDQEIADHGNIPFIEWAEEEEEDEDEDYEAEGLSTGVVPEPHYITEEERRQERRKNLDVKEAETVSANSTQLAVAVGVPPEIWATTSRTDQNSFIASLGLDVEQVRDFERQGDLTTVKSMVEVQNEETTGDLSLITCNVCGITASNLLNQLGGVCEITDPNAGANRSWVRGQSCPFEKYYSLDEAVSEAVEDMLEEEHSRIVQVFTPRRATAFASENVRSRINRYAETFEAYKGKRMRSESVVINCSECGCDIYSDDDDKRDCSICSVTLCGSCNNSCAGCSNTVCDTHRCSEPCCDGEYCQVCHEDELGAEPLGCVKCGGGGSECHSCGVCHSCCVCSVSHVAETKSSRGIDTFARPFEEVSEKGEGSRLATFAAGALGLAALWAHFRK